MYLLDFQELYLLVFERFDALDRIKTMLGNNKRRLSK